MCCMLTRFVGYKKITEVGNNFLATVTELQRQIILCKNMESKLFLEKRGLWLWCKGWTIQDAREIKKFLLDNHSSNFYKLVQRRISKVQG